MALALSLKNLSEALAAWHLPAPITVSELGSGFQGETWLVKAGDRRYVAKLCYDTQASFEVGLGMAALVERHGIPSGAPLRTIVGGSPSWWRTRPAISIRWRCSATSRETHSI
jgi:hypothetical protein